MSPTSEFSIKGSSLPKATEERDSGSYYTSSSKAQSKEGTASSLRASRPARPPAPSASASGTPFGDIAESSNNVPSWDQASCSPRPSVSPARKRAAADDEPESSSNSGANSGDDGERRATETRAISVKRARKAPSADANEMKSLIDGAKALYNFGGTRLAHQSSSSSSCSKSGRGQQQSGRDDHDDDDDGSGSSISSKKKNKNSNSSSRSSSSSIDNKGNSSNNNGRESSTEGASFLSKGISKRSSSLAGGSRPPAPSTFSDMLLSSLGGAPAAEQAGGRLHLSGSAQHAHGEARNRMSGVQPSLHRGSHQGGMSAADMMSMGAAGSHQIGLGHQSAEDDHMHRAAGSDPSRRPDGSCGFLGAGGGTQDKNNTEQLQMTILAQKLLILQYTQQMQLADFKKQIVALMGMKGGGGWDLASLAGAGITGLGNSMACLEGARNGSWSSSTSMPSMPSGHSPAQQAWCGMSSDSSRGAGMTNKTAASVLMSGSRSSPALGQVAPALRRPSPPRSKQELMDISQAKELITLQQQAKGMAPSLGDAGHGAGMVVPTVTSRGLLDALRMAQKQTSCFLRQGVLGGGRTEAGMVNINLLSSMVKKEPGYEGHAPPQQSTGDWAHLNRSYDGGR
jgi:hypothetical protein